MWRSRPQHRIVGYMAVRTVGVEEELLLIDPHSRATVPRSHQVLKQFHEHGAGRDLPEPHSRRAEETFEHELFRHQVELQTEPVERLDELFEQVRRARRTVGTAADTAGLGLAASGTSPLASDDTEVTDDPRYRAVVDAYGDVALDGGTCGLHVHVSVESDAEGVAVIDRLAPWLPLVLAISANSPYADSRDTSYASWRAQLWGRWPSAGPTERFGSVGAYRRVSELLVASGAAWDSQMLYFDARLSEAFPTVEVRVADVPTDPADTVLVAGLVRALVERAARDEAAGVTAPVWRPELLRAARWRASRMGLSGSLLHPARLELAPAGEVLDDLVGHLAGVLDDNGDTELVTDGVRRVRAATGATRQRAAYERTGSMQGVVDDLVARTRESWEA